MASKIINIKIFNELLDQFFDFLEDTFILFKSDIILIKTATEFVRRSNPRLVVEQFMQHVYPHSHKIFACDENYFINFKDNIH